MESWLNLSRNFCIILQQGLQYQYYYSLQCSTVFIAVDRFLALCVPLRYNDLVTNTRTIVSSAVGKLLLLLITALVFILDEEVQDCDKVRCVSSPVSGSKMIHFPVRLTGPCVSWSGKHSSGGKELFRGQCFQQGAHLV